MGACQQQPQPLPAVTPGSQTQTQTSGTQGGDGGNEEGTQNGPIFMLSPAHVHATPAWMEKDLLRSPCHIIPVGFFPASSSRRQGPLLHPLCLLSSPAEISLITWITRHQPLVSYAEPICWKSLLAPQHLFEPPSPSHLSAAVIGGPGGSPPSQARLSNRYCSPCHPPHNSPPGGDPTRPLACLSESGRQDLGFRLHHVLSLTKLAAYEREGLELKPQYRPRGAHHPMTQEMELITLSHTQHVNTQNKAGKDSEATRTSDNSHLPTQALPGYPEPQGTSYSTYHAHPGWEAPSSSVDEGSKRGPEWGPMASSFPGQDATG